MKMKKESNQHTHHCNHKCRVCPIPTCIKLLLRSRVNLLRIIVLQIWIPFKMNGKDPNLHFPRYTTSIMLPETHNRGITRQNSFYKKHYIQITELVLVSQVIKQKEKQYRQLYAPKSK